MTDILNGTSVMEVLGGNHTRQVLTELQYSENVPVVIYAGLTNDHNTCGMSIIEFTTTIELLTSKKMSCSSERLAL